MDVLTICMFSNLYPPVVSGSSTQTVFLARQLAQQGHKVIVITARVEPSLPEYSIEDGVHVYRLKAYVLPKLPIALNFPWLNFTFGPSNLKRVAGILDEHQPDILHLHNHMFDLGFIATRMRKQYRIPLVITIHTIIRHSNPVYNLILLPADRVLLKRLIIDKSDQVICPDFNVKRYVEEVFKRSESVIIPYGITPLIDYDKSRVEMLREKYHLDGKRVILSLGHVHEIRNRHDLIAAMPRVLNELPETILLIVGAVSTKSPLRLAETLKVHESVIFTGSVLHNEIPNYLALADIEAHWLNQEAPERTSLGIASLEAMLAGKVVIAAANPDTYGEGLLKSGENIIIVPAKKPDKLAKTLVALLEDRERCQAIGQRAKESVLNNFSWVSVATQTIQTYQSVLEKHQLRKRNESNNNLRYSSRDYPIEPHH